MRRAQTSTTSVGSGQRPWTICPPPISPRIRETDSTPGSLRTACEPGPATGLPTRTEQADLELALYAGHGEFPRILLAPGRIEDAFYLTRRAFCLADKYQVPVFILTDQYFVDSYYNTTCFDLSDTRIEKHIVKTDSDYRRYELTANGISPRAIPGFGQGLVVVDSDEHDEAGGMLRYGVSEAELPLRLAGLSHCFRKIPKQNVRSFTFPYAVSSHGG